MALTRIDSYLVDLDSLGGVTFDDQAGTPTFKVDAVNHRVGIGISNPSSILNVGSKTLTSDTDNQIILSGRKTGGSGTYAGFYFKNSQDAGGSSASIRALREGDNYGTELALYTQIYGQGAGGDGAERLRITSTGNVGIGTTNPEQKLHVQGSIRAQVTGGGTGILLHSNTGWSAASNLAQFWTGQTEGFAFYANDSGNGTNERLRITASGNVGIGTTNPGVKLDVDGIIRLTASGNYTSYATRLYSRLDSTHCTVLESYLNSSTPFELIGSYADNGGTNPRVVISAGGQNVGIGTTNPTQKLHVEGNLRLGTDPYIQWISNYLRFQTTSASVPVIEIRESSSGNYEPRMDFYDGDGITKNISIDANPSNPTYFKAGNVGVGTTNPTEKLHVSGNILSSYNILTSSLQISSLEDAFSYLSIDGAVTYLSYNGTSIGLASRPGYGISSNLYIGGGFPIIHAGWSGTISGVATANATSLGTSVHLQTSTDGSTWTTRDSTSGASGKTLTYSVSSSATPLYVRFQLVQSSGGSVGENACRISNVIITNLQSLPNKPSISNKFLLHSSGNVGIGTTNPITKLDVRGVITAGSVSSPNGSEILRGFYGNTDGALNVIGSEYSSGGTIIGYGVKPSTAAGAQFYSSTPVTLERGAYTIAGDGHRWYNGASQTVAENSSVTMNEVMRLSSSGNVGIGTTNPVAKLHLLDTDAQFYQQATRGTGRTWRTGTSGTNAENFELLDSTGAQRAYLYGSSSGGYSGWSFYSNGLERVRIDGSGNVGIGTTNPGEPLSIYRNINSGSQIRNWNASSGSDAFTAYRLSSDAANSVWWWLNSSTRTTDGGASTSTIRNDAGDMRLQAAGEVGLHIKASTGNIGIGVPNPSAKLTVDGSINQNWSDVRLGIFYDNNFRQGLAYSTSERTLKIFSTTADSGGNIAFYTRNGLGASDTDYGTQRMVISAAGNVGIGTTNPQAKLHIEGEVKVQTHRALTSEIDYYTSGRSRLSSSWFIVRKSQKANGAGVAARATITFSGSSGSPNAFHRVRVTQGGSVTLAYYDFLVGESNGVFSVLQDLSAYNKVQFTVSMSSPTLTITSAAASIDWMNMTIEVETFEMGDNAVSVVMSTV